MARQGNDPARQVAEQKYKKLRIEYNELWKIKYKEIGKRLKTASLIPNKRSRIVALKENSRL